ncbi:MAG: flagellar biosynthesis protein FlgA [Rhodospirillales bacterium RIFCSPLOWO2_12_FULL_58_28]|nr:MAG: flagellar biosynthesis protein FlgA [Rhodospirillales bacterium RIFCSPLOWO2_02_FULL_58_16]OHC78579.1 MAG: flagellar biosynthesis protein FlgA [Rhodospirillales bacterium RIFCSPLOWO2_12_FULL_58_28]
MTASVYSFAALSTKNALKRILIGGAAGLTLMLITMAGAEAASRIKDIAVYQGVRDNMLVGYGLVVGLNGTGDTLSIGHFTQQSLQAMLNRLGIKPTDAGIDSKNVAAVMVTATLPPFARQGSRIDVTVSAIGDSKNLLGGTLLVTPLLGADSEVYAVSQGQLAVGGFTATGKGETVTKGVPTSARIANGAIIEREIGFEMADLKSIKLSLRNPDFTTANRISQAINAFLGTPAAVSTDHSTVQVAVPESYRSNVVNLLTDIEQLRIEPDQAARVIIDEQSGVIVMGEDVRISTVAIAQGNLTIRITETPQVSQPGPFASVGDTTTVDRTDIQIDQGGDRRLTVVNSGVTLQDLVNGLNALGIGPRDMITILQAVKAAGAMQADIGIM